jgi:hypothetical protein
MRGLELEQKWTPTLRPGGRLPGSAVTRSTTGPERIPNLRQAARFRPGTPAGENQSWPRSTAFAGSITRLARPGGLRAVLRVRHRDHRRKDHGPVLPRNGIAALGRRCGGRALEGLRGRYGVAWTSLLVPACARTWTKGKRNCDGPPRHTNPTHHAPASRYVDRQCPQASADLSAARTTPHCSRARRNGLVPAVEDSEPTPAPQPAVP